MALPELIEVVPPATPIEAEIAVPGSKSITNRALILAALAEGETTLRGALWSEDTQVMVECLQDLGFMVNVEPDPFESCNRSITVYGLGGRVPRGGTPDQPMELFVGNAGTAARFLSAFVCLGAGVYRLHGVPRMHERPQSALFTALRQLGYRVDSANNRLPAQIHGGGERPARCQVSIEDSSQFASALLLSARTGRWTIEVVGENIEESPYVAMTSKLIAAFPNQGGKFQIEPDASSGSYLWAAEWLLNSAVSPIQPGAGRREPLADFKSEPVPAKKISRILVPGWPDSGWQIDARFPDFLPLPGNVSRERDLGDSIMTAIVLAPLSGMVVRFTELGRLRVQECERVIALRTELTKCGARVTEEQDSLTVSPSSLHGAEIDTYQDHRMAMCFSVLGLKIPGMKIKNPACVKKTFPNFFQKLAAPPPQGLGAQVLEASSGRPMTSHELFAD